MSDKVPNKVAKIIEYYSIESSKITKKYNELVKWIGTSSLAFLPFFVSLIPSNNQLNDWLLVLYISIVSSIALGLLSVCVILFGGLSSEKKLLNQTMQILAEPQSWDTSYQVKKEKLPLCYKISRYVFSISYIIFFITFITFCILIAL